jgi:hypothetical protein
MTINEVGEILFAGDSEGNVIVWNADKAVRLHKMKMPVTKYKHNSSVLKSIRGINLSYDENTVLVYTKSKLAYYKFESFREEKSKDVYKKFKVEEGATSQKVR